MLDSISKNIKLQYFILFIIAVLAYGNTLNHSYTWDDALVITQNKYTKAGLSRVNDIWTKKVFLHNRSVYRPVAQTLYAITYQIAPNNPKAAHFVNIFFYGLSIMVTFWFLRLLFQKQNKWLLIFITLLFTLHPIHTEVVANIKSLDEILAYFFGVLSLSIWIKTLQKKSVLLFVLTLLLMLAAILSKISSITLIPLYFLIFYFIHKFDYSIYSRLSNFLSQKYYPKNFIILIDFLSIIFLLLSFYFHIHFLGILIILFLSLIVHKTQDFKHIVLQTIFISGILVIFNWNTTLLYFLLSLFFLRFEKGQKNKASLILLFFVLTNFLISTEQGDYIYFIPFSLILYFLHRKNKLFSIVFLAIIIILNIFSRMDLDPISLSSILIIIFLSIQKKIPYRKQMIVLIICLFVALFYDSIIFKKIDLSYEVETYYDNNKPTDEKNDINVEMSPLHNTLTNENNTEIKFATIAKIQLKYIKLLFFPHPLVHQYGFNQISKTNFKDWKVWFSIIIHLVLFLFALYKLKDKSPISFGILYYFTTISIYANIVVLMPDTLAERFLFTPSLGFFITIVFATNSLLKVIKTKRLGLALSIILIPILFAFTYKTIDRNKAWKNNFILAKNTIKHAPNNAAINAQYATELYLRNKNPSLMVKHYKRAIEIYPAFYSASKDLANYYVKQGQANKAEKLFLKCVEINKYDWESYYFLAFIYYESKNYPEAIKAFKETIIDGDTKIGKEKYIYSSEFLARCYFNSNQISLADKLLNENYEKYKAKSSMILLGNIYNQSGNTAKSIKAYSSLLKDFPDDQDLIKTIEILKNQ